MKNNNEKFENFIRDFDTIRMTTNEKNEMQNNLEVFVRNNSVQLSPYHIYSTYFRKSLAVALVILMTISLSKPASAKAIPGELLYNVKIIHEEIEAATIKKPEKKVSFEIKRTETRIREAVKLAETKKLDASAQQKLAEKIKEHVKEISSEIEEIKGENPEQALTLNSDLKTTLKVNSEALKEVTKKTVRKKKKAVEEPETVAEEIITEETEKEIVEETIVEEEIIIESFADIILDSIEEDIEKTEDISESIEKEIIADETELVTETTPTPETEIVETQAEITEELVEEEIIADETELAGETTIPAPETEIVEPQAEITEELVEEEIIADETELVGEETSTPETEIVENIITTEAPMKETEITEDVGKEIASLENILLSEEKVKALSQELNHTRDPLKVAEIKTLIEKKKLGQAYIKLQNEIDMLSELRLSLELNTELGISIELNQDDEQKSTLE